MAEKRSYATRSVFGDNITANISANKFANGADQNNGNVMTGRSTTRIHAPPGGHSSICFNDASMEPTKATREVEAKITERPATPIEHVPRSTPPIGGAQTFRFGAGSPPPPQTAGTPVGGKATITFGSHNRSPVPPNQVYGGSMWMDGNSPPAAGKRLNAVGFTRGEQTHDIGDEAENRKPSHGQAVRHCRPTKDDENYEAPASARQPPGGASTISLGDEKRSPGHQRTLASPAPPRILEEKINQLQGRAPPGGRSQICLG